MRLIDSSYDKTIPKVSIYYFIFRQRVVSRVVPLTGCIGQHMIYKISTFFPCF